jgi:DNA-entry nuclease
MRRDAWDHLKILLAAAVIFAAAISAAALPPFVRADFCAPGAVTSFTYKGMKIPAYDGDSYETVNGNDPRFSAADLKRAKSSYQTYSALDSRGRCGPATASISFSLMPKYTRGSITNVHPSGWVQDKYDIVPGRYLYNRCHLIGFQLTGVDCVHKMKEYAREDLITGTRYMNVGSGSDGMVGFENEVADYIRSNPDYHVLYRVTPIYRNRDDLVASGVLMEAESVETKSVEFCVYCYNVQPGIAIDYGNGLSELEGTVGVTPGEPEKCEIESLQTQKRCYVTSSGKRYHLRKTCAGAGASGITIAQAMSAGYTPCARCAKSRGFTVVYKTVPGATAYDVSYRTGTGKWRTVRSTSVRSKTVNNVTPGRTYTVKVRAVSSGEPGKYGSEKQIHVD